MAKFDKNLISALATRLSEVRSCFLHLNLKPFLFQLIIAEEGSLEAGMPLSLAASDFRHSQCESLTQQFL